MPVFADRLVEAGRLGRKTGRGYYIYDDQSLQGRPDPELEPMLDAIRADLGITPRDFTDDEIRSRYMAAMVNEGARILDEGIAARAGDSGRPEPAIPAGVLSGDDEQAEVPGSVEAPAPLDPETPIQPGLPNPPSQQDGSDLGTSGPRA